MKKIQMKKIQMKKIHGVEKGDSIRFSTADVAVLLAPEDEEAPAPLPARRGRPRKTSAPC